MCSPAVIGALAAWRQRDNVVYWKSKRKINDDLQWRQNMLKNKRAGCVSNWDSLMMIAFITTLGDIM